jgi:3-polyprenyl-4-hydroxybenzoate decarboxylase
MMKQVDEIGAITRKTYDTYGDASPALLFENVKDYPPPGPNKLFIGFFRSYRRLAMLLDLDPFSSAQRDIVLHLRKKMTGSEGVGKGTPQKFPPPTKPSRKRIELVKGRWES